MFRILTAIAIVAVVFHASPHRDGRDLTAATAAARDAAAALPKPDGAEAALAALLLRGALGEGRRAAEASR